MQQFDILDTSLLSMDDKFMPLLSGNMMPIAIIQQTLQSDQIERVVKIPIVLRFSVADDDAGVDFVHSVLRSNTPYGIIVILC